MTNLIDNIPNAEVGERLRLARETAGVTQAAAAMSIEVARTTLVAMERGQRRVRLAEARELARLYGTSLNAMLRKDAVAADLSPRFRKLVAGEDTEADAAAKLLANLARAETELENLLGVQRPRTEPPERPLLRGDVTKQAEQNALELRQWLGLGHSPIQDIVTLLEMELGVRVYARRLPSSISGLFAYEETLGPCMLLNASHPRERRALTAAHEVGHYISTRREAEVLHEGEVETSREEQYANTFAKVFLMPPRAVMQHFNDIVAGANTLTRRHVIMLAHVFGVSREAMVRRLEELGLAKQGTWDWFRDHGGITNEQARQVLGSLMLGDQGKQDADRPLALRLSALAGEVYRRELLSEGQLARLLHIDRITLRELFEDLDPDGSAADDGPDLPV